MADLMKDIEARKAALKQQEEARNALAQMLADLAELLASGHTEQAFMMAQQRILPAKAELSSDIPTEVLAAGVNITTSVQAFLTDAQNSLHSGKALTPADAANFVKRVKDLYTEIKKEQGLPSDDQQWLDSGLAGNILKALDGVAKEFGGASALDTSFNANNVFNSVTQWNKDPTKPVNPSDPKSKTAQEALQSLDGWLAMGTNACASRSQALGADVNYTLNTGSQIYAALTAMQKSSIDFQRAMVQAQVRS
jgi:hypothetical protein